MPESMCWRELAEQATKETDPQKPTKIIEELCGVLDLRKETGREPVAKEKSA
jgi:hypothetical protein